MNYLMLIILIVNFQSVFGKCSNEEQITSCTSTSSTTSTSTLKNKINENSSDQAIEQLKELVPDNIYCKDVETIYFNIYNRILNNKLLSHKVKNNGKCSVYEELNINNNTLEIYCIKDENNTESFNCYMDTNKVIDAGSFKIVTHAISFKTDINTEFKSSVVLFPKLERGKEAISSMEKEYHFGKIFKEKNINTAYIKDACIHDGNLIGFMELYQGTLDFSENTKLDLNNLNIAINDTLFQLNQLHDENIVHRDIKPGNILVKDNRFFLSDFGTSLDMNHLNIPFKNDQHTQSEHRLPFLNKNPSIQRVEKHFDARGSQGFMTINSFPMLTINSDNDRRADVLKKDDVLAMGLVYYKLMEGHQHDLYTYLFNYFFQLIEINHLLEDTSKKRNISASLSEIRAIKKDIARSEKKIKQIRTNYDRNIHFIYKKYYQEVNNMHDPIKKRIHQLILYMIHPDPSFRATASDALNMAQEIFRY